jgi:two-component system, cell cycle response regulator
MKRIHTQLTPLYCYLVVAAAASVVYFSLNQLITVLLPAHFPAAGQLSNVSGTFIGTLYSFCSLLFPLRRRSSAKTISHSSLPIKLWGPILLGLVFLTNMAGQVVILFNQLHHITGFPAWNDAFFLGAYPLLLIVLLMLPARSLSRAASMRSILDSLIILMTLLLFLWSFFLGPLMIRHSWWYNVVGMAYPFGNLVLLCWFLLLSARSIAPELRVVKWLLLTGLIFLVVGSIENEYETLLNNVSYSYIQTIAWSAAYVLFGLTTYFLRFVGAPQQDARGSSQGQSPLWLSLLPYGFVPATMILLFSSWHDSLQSAVQQGVYIGVVGIYMLLLLRQLLSSWETRRYAKQLYVANERLSSLATTDPLTNLANHRALAAALSQELVRAQRYAHTCALLFLDLDHFKALNDGYGHAAGDTVLHTFAALIQSSLRASDTVGRWGGEEFIVILPETGAGDALIVAERIRSTVSQYAFEVGGGLHLTCSIGVACYPDHAQNQQTLVHAADQAMYGAKRLGRNQVRAIDDPAVQTLVDENCAGEDREEAALRGTVKALAMLVERRDPSSGNYTHQVADLVYDLARSLHIPEGEAHMLALAGQLHDIGKVAIPDALLQRPGPLTREEWKQMQHTPAIGAEVISHIPSLRPLAPIIGAQRERWDGQGYPDHLAGYTIPAGSRLLAVAIAYIVMINGRPYQTARSAADALAEIQRCAGTQFDPEIVDALVNLLGQKQDQKLAELAHLS